MVINKMQKKIIIALAALVVVAVVLVGVASAQIAAYQNNTTYPNGAPTNGFLGWVGRCYQYWSNWVSGNQGQIPYSPNLPPNGTTTIPNQGAYYPHPPCWARW